MKKNHINFKILFIPFFKIYNYISSKGISNKFCLRNILIPMIPLYFIISKRIIWIKKTHIFFAYSYFKICNYKKNHIIKLFWNLTYIHIYNYKNKYTFTVKIRYMSDLINFFFFKYNFVVVVVVVFVFCII